MRIIRNKFYQTKLSGRIIVRVVFIRNYQCVYEICKIPSASASIMSRFHKKLMTCSIKLFCNQFELIPDLKAKLLYEESKINKV